MTINTQDTVAPITPTLEIRQSFKVLIDPQITFVTTLGTVVFELNPTSAPATVSNMLDYVNDAFYDGTLFHRVIPNFMVQGGGFTTDLVYKAPTYPPIVLESANGLSNLRGTLAMARTNVADSATSQFFVNLVDNTFLNYSSTSSPGYAVFGKVVSGLSVIDSIAGIPTTTVGLFDDVPQTDVVISTATQTLFESSISKTGIVAVGALEKGSTWEYSINGGTSWIKGKGSQISLPEGTYAAHMVEVRQKDAAGNLSTGTDISDGILTVDKTAPTISTFSPTKGAKEVGITDNILLTFSEDIQLGTGSLVLKTAAGEAIETFTVTPSTVTSNIGKVLTINPTHDLLYGVKYKLEITSGSVVDVAGNLYSGTKSYQFMTTDTVTTSDVSYTLTTEANKLTYSGTADFIGLGNSAMNIITGSIGNDRLNGGLGNDKLIGGGGVDAFIFDSALNKNVDTITGFTPKNDQLQLDTHIFTKLVAGGLAAGNFVSGMSVKAYDSDDYVLFNTKTGALYYDADGSGGGVAVKFAVLTGVSDLSATDFLIIGDSVLL